MRAGHGPPHMKTAAPLRGAAVIPCLQIRESAQLAFSARSPRSE